MNSFTSINFQFLQRRLWFKRDLFGKKQIQAFLKCSTSLHLSRILNLSEGLSTEILKRNQNPSEGNNTKENKPSEGNNTKENK